MKLKNSFIRFAIGTDAIPDSPCVSGSTHIGCDLKFPLPDAAIAWSTRIYFHGLVSAEIQYVDGQIQQTGDLGVCQVETATVVAAAGCSSNGNLAVTVTGARIAGSPITLMVPLTTADYTNNISIAQAISDILSVSPAITDQYEVSSQSAVVMLRSRKPYANDATLNLAIAAGRGVSAVIASVNSLAGVAGISIESLGIPGSGTDLYGQPLGSSWTPLGHFFSVPQSSDNPVHVGDMVIDPGGVILRTGMTMFSLSPQSISSTGHAIIDIIFIGK